MKDYKIIDSFLFNGEFEMLKMRLDYYYDTIDYFLICESDYTQMGQKKDLTYPLNSHLFDAYKDKIRYIVYSPTQEDIEKVKTNSFHLENLHIDYTRATALELSDASTMTMVSGVDEFPKKEVLPEMWNRCKDMVMDAVSCKMRTYYYSPLCELDIECYATTAVNHNTLRDVNRLSDLRKYTFNCPHIEDGGWHLSFFHTPELIQRKIQIFAHSEYNNDDTTNLENIKYRMYNCLDVLNRPEIKIIKHEEIKDEFPMEFYRHDIFFRNTFGRAYLRPMMAYRKKEYSMQIPLEIENLQLAVAKREPKIIVEIGTAKGGTLAMWFEVPSAEEIYSIDFPTGIHGGQGYEERVYTISDAMEQAGLHGKKFYPLNGSSQNSYLINRLRELLGGKKIDFLFIDGDHTYNGVKNDYLVYREFLSDNAIVAFHDVIPSEYHAMWDCFVSTFWNEISQDYEKKEFIFTHLIDEKIHAHFFEHAKPYGGFGGIGFIEYGKRKERIQLPETLNEDIETPISLVVPIYGNSAITIEMLQKTLSSSKSINDVIMYSNGTSDAENNILQDFANKYPIIKLYKIPKGLGFVKAVNEGFKLAKNEVILCMNSDAAVYDNWEEQLMPLIKNTNNAVVGPVKANGFILGCCFIVRKSILNKIGMLNEGFGMGYYDDTELCYRAEKNGYNLGYICLKDDLGWTRNVNFPIVHLQGVSFSSLDKNDSKKEMKENKLKYEKYKRSDNVVILKDLDYNELKKSINDDEVYIAVNKSGENFEKIRYDKEILSKINLYECTPEMNIDEIIKSVSAGKRIKESMLIKPIEMKIKKTNSLTWLAKYDDHASMGILSQRILEKLTDTDISCKPIIGETETRNPLVHKWLSNPKNHDLGIMFSYPDMFPQLDEFKTKVIYTGVDTTGGIANFAENSNKADFLLTPSEKSKERMTNLGVKKPIYVLPHGIDKDKFNFKPRVKGEKFKFLYVGECSDRKGIFQLLDAFIGVFSNNKNVELHLKSNDAMVFYNGQDVKKYVDTFSNIFWHVSNEGHEKILDLYNDCHVYVYPSRADTFGMTLIEAMACGLPIISTSEPGATELIKNMYYEIPSKLVPVKNHPWMLGEWGEPETKLLMSAMKTMYKDYDILASEKILRENSDFVRKNYSWDNIVSDFEENILPKLNKQTKIITLLTSFNRPHHIKNVINSLKDVRDKNCINDVYIVENSFPEMKEESLRAINESIDEHFTVYNSDFNMGQRGALLQLLEDVDINEYDFIQFTDQDNLFQEPLSTYCDILNENRDIFFVTGYMSKEHGELGWRKTRFGNLCEKRSLRAGHMFMRISDLKSLFPLHLDAHYGKDYNSSWNAGLDWELSWWNKNAPAKMTDKNFVLCVPGGVLHVGLDSTIYKWDVESCEYKLEELIELRK
jgi:glycosyltransferase involved in cell wall biosynthesis/predicted O-methyltransferase YrrM